MKPSKLPLVLLATALATLAVAVAACSGKGSCKSCGVPKGVTNCQIDWASQGATTGRYNVYVVDLPLADWNNGTKNYNFTAGDQINAVYYNDFLQTSNGNLYESRAITTAGTFTLAVAGTAINTTVQFNDDGGHQFWNIDGANHIGSFQGTGGTGQFVGSIEDGNNITGSGSGSIGITYQGTSQVLGQAFSYALCYAKPATGFAPAGPSLPVGLRPN